MMEKKVQEIEDEILAKSNMVRNTKRFTIDDKTTGEPLDNYCEWCGMRYPLDSWDYYDVTVFREYHKICSDCKEQLKKVK
jgi:hypothetical protein